MTGRIVGNGKSARYYIDGKQVTKRAFDAAFPDKPIGTGAGLLGWKPLVSDALAVHPNQVKEAIDDARAKGVSVDFKEDGRPVFTSRQQRKEYCKAYGFYDRNAGYGDQADGGPRRAEKEAADREANQIDPEV
jgi:hypothetical protein